MTLRWGIVWSHSRTWVATLNGSSATLLRALDELQGATFSNPAQRGSYDSEARAVMTLGELERWLTQYIVGVYYAKRHRGIGTSPLQRWTAGVFGDEGASAPASRRR